MFRFFRPFALAVAPIVAIVASTGPAAAQAGISSTTRFLKAVEERDGAVVTQMLTTGGAQTANVQGGDREESALHIVVRRRDGVWTQFLIAKGARPDVLDKAGKSPLMVAVFNDDAETARILLANGASADFVNGRGETALILAVQLRKPALVRLLVAHGADPDRADFVAGLSARDYALRDARATSLIEALTPRAEADSSISFGPAAQPGD